MKKINLGIILFIGLLISACNESTPATKLTCSEITTEKLGIDGLKITLNEEISAVADSNYAVDHCRITGIVEERIGIDDDAYAIKFELRLPDVWNEKFVHQFNGGNDGVVKPAIGDSPVRIQADNALNRGYAVISSDAGHDETVPQNAGQAQASRFGMDPIARINYGYGAVAKLNPKAKKAIEAYYGKNIKYSYGIGGSNGGRHAMVAATRMPDAFDGLLVGFPGFNLPKAALQHALDFQQFTRITGLLDTSFSPDDLNVVSTGIKDSCDALDGLADGMVNAIEQCQATFDISTLECADGQTIGCLTYLQVEVLSNIYKGPHNSRDEQLYSSWAWDPGISSGNWAFWKLRSPIPPWEFRPLDVARGGSSLSQVFTTPPTKVGGTIYDLEDYLRKFSFDIDAPKIFAIDSTYTESAMSFMTPLDVNNPVMANFKASGGKMMIVHGQSDPVFSVEDTSNWYKKLDANNDNNAKSFVKFYRVPGMLHANSGVSTDNVDMLTALENWVEKGVEPQELVATTTPGNTELPIELEGVTRLLCPYPKVAFYEGTDPKVSDSFVCKEETK